MCAKKIKIKTNFDSLNQVSINKPSTVTRAAITAEIKPTRGKQLVEHNPLLLIPDPNNPRPGDQIDDAWLKKYLMVATENSLCRFSTDLKEYIIPYFSELNSHLSDSLENDYEFLRSLAYSIRNEGLIEPIEIFLADKNSEPEYFTNSQLEYGYVVLEGHQRRLAGIMAGVSTVTCIEITDETMLARLKVKHRKLRRQLSENNLRKGLTVSQNFIIVRKLLESSDCVGISVKELSSIIGLNEDISGALKRLSLSVDNFPKGMIDLIEKNVVSFKWIRSWVGKPYDQIESEVERLNSYKIANQIQKREIIKVKARGRQGGAVKRSAIFKVNQENDSKALQDYLLNKIPELILDLSPDMHFNNLEKLLDRLMQLAKENNPTRVGNVVTY